MNFDQLRKRRLYPVLLAYAAYVIVCCITVPIVFAINRLGFRMPEAAAFDSGMMIAMPIGFVTAVVVYLRLAWKPKPGHCTKCNYDLTGNTSGRCPECGEPIGPDDSSET